MRKIILFIFVFFFVITNCSAASKEESHFNLDIIKFDPKAPIDISSDTLEIEELTRKNQYVFFYKGDVVLIQAATKIYCDNLKIIYDSKKKEVIHSDFQKNVKINFKETVCTCDEAIYMGDKNILKFIGNLKILKGKNVFYGDQLDIDTISNKSILKGGKERIKTYFSGEK